MELQLQNNTEFIVIVVNYIWSYLILQALQQQRILFTDYGIVKRVLYNHFSL